MGMDGGGGAGAVAMWWWLGGKRGVGGEGSFGVLLLLTTATDEPVPEGLGHPSACFRRFSSSGLAESPSSPTPLECSRTP